MAAMLINYESSLTCEYINVVRQHVINPLELSGVGDSCFAAAMLVFGSIDGLGKLIHQNCDVGSGDRFKYFLQRMGPAYVRLGDELWKLRNSLAHNAMNVACFMSKTENARGEHLEITEKYVFIHTIRLLEDFKLAIDQLEIELCADIALLKRAESRLRPDYIGQLGWRGVSNTSTPPPGIRFVSER